MSIVDAFEELIESDEYKNICKQRNGIGGKYRTYRIRFNNIVNKKTGERELKAGAMVEILIANGYTVTAHKIVSKRK